jgi:hypothetical protein
MTTDTDTRNGDAQTALEAAQAPEGLAAEIRSTLLAMGMPPEHADREAKLVLAERPTP